MAKSFLAIIVFILPIACNQHLTQSQSVCPQEFNYDTSKKEKGEMVELALVAKTDSILRGWADKRVVPQIVTFFSKNGFVLHHAAYGYSDIESGKPIKLNSLFRNASQTKAVVSVALMILHEEGKFTLDDKIKDYIPSFKNPQVLVKYNPEDTTYTTRPALGDITVRQLLTHSSGIAYGGLEGDPWRAVYQKVNVPYAFTFDTISTQTVASRIGSLPLAFDPGTELKYGMNIDVAGALIEILSGEPLNQFLYEKIFKPLGMNDTYFLVPESEQERIVTLYGRKKAGGILEKVTDDLLQNYMRKGSHRFVSGGAGMVGPIEDYAKFCQMIINRGTFNNHRILGRKTIELINSNHVGNLYGNFGVGFGYKIHRDNADFQDIATEGSLEWGGMFNTLYLIDPKENIVCISYTNMYLNKGAEKINTIYRNMIYSALK